MKSLLISGTYFPPQTGGISHMMASIACALGPDRVCCLTGAAANGQQNSLQNLPNVYRSPRAFANSTLIQAVPCCAVITRIMLREQPRIVQLASVAEGYLGLRLRQWLGLPFVVYAHGNEILAALELKWPKPRLALQQAERVFANSSFTADLVAQAGIAREKIEIIRPGCEVGRFQPRSPREDLKKRLLGDKYNNKVILTVGGLVARKGHDMVIRAFARLRESLPNVSYLIVGAGPYRSALEKLVGELRVADHVVFAGQIGNEELADVYNLCDVFVMASRPRMEQCDVEGFGLVFLEANACGKPVVGGRSGGIADAVLDGVTGLLVNPNDPEDIAGALKRILMDNEFAAVLGRQGRDRVTSQFTWSQVATRVHGILESQIRAKTST